MLRFLKRGKPGTFVDYCVVFAIFAVVCTLWYQWIWRSWYGNIPAWAWSFTTWMRRMFPWLPF